MYAEVHYAVIYYENEKAKPVYYLVQLVDLDDPNYQRWERLPERQEVASDPTLARAIGCDVG